MNLPKHLWIRAIAKIKTMLAQMDPRIFQIVFLSCFLMLGISLYAFQIQWIQVLLCLAGALSAQVIWFSYFRIRPYSFRSAIITALGLSLLLRANVLWVHPVVSFLAISSKFWIRVDHKHIFNPANFGIIVGISVFPCWVSLGQWGHALVLSFLLTMLGFVVTQKARVYLISLKFLLLFALLVFGRNAFLGFEPVMGLRSMQSGALLLFAFYMISDPKTLPKTDLYQWIHALVVVGIFGILRFHYAETYALFWALFVGCMLIPIWNHLALEPLHDKKLAIAPFFGRKIA